MPHLVYDQATLDVRYPSLTAPVQLDVDDTEADAYDAIYQRGLREAEGIAEPMRLYGRMKYMRQRDSSGDAKALTTRGKGEVCLLRSTGGHTHGCCIAVAGGMVPTRTGPSARTKVSEERSKCGFGGVRVAMRTVAA